MKQSGFHFLTMLVALSLLLAACGASTPAAQPTSTQPPTAATKTAIIGFTASENGSLNVESERQVNGLNLWIEQVNAAGGIKLADGAMIKFEAKSYDDVWW